MYFYHGDKHYYLTKIFLNDEELKEIAYSNGMTYDYDKLSYALADNLYNFLEDYIINKDLSAEEFYAAEYEKYLLGQTASAIIAGIQSAIYSVYERDMPWYLVSNKGFYIAVLKTAIYGSIKHFFFQHRDKYLPQYDWYLIESNPKRKAIMEMLFREFDKLTNMSDALKYYQDPDDIPLEFIIYLQEITGFSMNTYNGLFNDKQLRSLTKHLIEIWRGKSSTFSIELFFACMGIDCAIKELWFDRRRFFDPGKFNSFTNVRNIRSFGYYLTPYTPHTVSYEYSTESVSYSDYTAPKSSRMWDYKLSKVSEQEQDKKLRELLGIDPSDEDTTYTFFKSNYLLFSFNYIGQNKIIYQQELNVYKELIRYMLPAYIRVYYGNEYESSYGNNDYDVFGSYGLENPPFKKHENTNDYYIVDKNGFERPIELFQMFDTAPGIFSYDHVPGLIGTDYVPADKVGNKFVSGTYINVYDCRFTQYITNNGIFKLTEDTAIQDKDYFIFDNDNPRLATEEEKVDKNLGRLYEKIGDLNMSALVGSPNYDVVGGDGETAPGIVSETIYNRDEHEYYKVGIVKYPFYNDESHEYIITGENQLTREDGEVGQLIIDISETDERADIPEDSGALIHYYFKVNGSEKKEIYPNLFFDSNNYSCVITEEGSFNNVFPKYNEVFGMNFGTQIENWDRETFDQKYTDNPHNLFESSIWRTYIETYNELYNEDTWNGYVQYEYSQYTNPIEFVETKLTDEGGDLTIDLI